MAIRNKAQKREAQLGFESLSIEGGLLSPEWLSRVAQLAAGSQTEADYLIPKGLNVRDEIGRYWRIAHAHWADFATGRAGNADARILAERFVQAFLRESLGFGSLVQIEAVVIDDRAYPIGFSALTGRVPIVIAPAGLGLDALLPALGDGGRRRSAFGLTQEYLNAASGALWGVASDGATLRILRDNASLTRPAWIEVDLARMFTEERYADFAALWLLAHETRFGRADQPVTDCALEIWRNAGREEGTRAREHLRRGVEDALIALGQGFVAHPDNQQLRGALQKGDLTTKAYFNQLLRLVYRLIFLLTVEERGLLHPDNANEKAKALYASGYGMRRLRDRSVKRSAHDRFSDLWESTKIVFSGLAAGEPRLGLPALAGIFAKPQCPDLDGARLENRFLLLAVFKLSWLRETSGISRVNWRDMGPEELGSVYESLLELMPQIGLEGREFSFAAGDEVKGHARRTSGSYYTPDKLVQVLLDRALEPVIASAVARSPANPVDALLSLSIVDPACGSGHFLLAAARRLAVHVSRYQANGTPSAVEYRRALRKVVGHCIYGTDLNAMAVELCKVSLWMEAVEPGLPLTFLNSHVLHGNALLGTTIELMANGIPDSAWEPFEGDDKKIASALKKRNKKHANDQQLAWSFVTGGVLDESAKFNAAMIDLESAADDSVEALSKKEQQWDGILTSGEFRHQKLAADAWCAAFLWPKQPGELSDVAPTNEQWRQIRDGQGKPPSVMVEKIQELATKHHFFHWHLAFPHVFSKGGFDVVLGNPPWIAHAGRAAQSLPPGVKSYFQANYESFADYPTTHGMFVTVAARSLRTDGYLGLVVPASLSELGGYAPTRAAHDKLCDFPQELVDFGEGQFPGVTQPCMALVSRRCSHGRNSEIVGEPWPMERPDLNDTAKSLIARLSELPVLPAELFGERGVQSDKALAEHFRESREPADRFTTPIREGTDVREFQLLPPRFHVDRNGLGGRIRTVEEFESVRIVVRQTARYPIAALSDGIAFRNSLVAAFESTDWPAHALLALLNSAFVRWLHFFRFRDARQPVMPQLKIGHLRAIPRPPIEDRDAKTQLENIGKRLTVCCGIASPAERAELDAVVFGLYRLSPEEQELVLGWHDTLGPQASVRRQTESSASEKKAEKRALTKGKVK